MTTTNFSFLQQEFLPMLETDWTAEQHFYMAPMYSAILCRKCLEEWVRCIYDNDKDVKLPYDTTRNSFLHEQTLKQVPPHEAYETADKWTVNQRVAGSSPALLCSICSP